MTEDDMSQYQVQWSQPVSVHLDSMGVTLYSNPPPASGAIMAYILNILDHYNIQPDDDEALLYHRITEAFKWAFAQRTELGDPNDSDITDIVNNLVANLTDKSQARDVWSRISGRKTSEMSFSGAKTILK